MFLRDKLLFIHFIILLEYQSIGLVIRVFAKGLGDRVQSQVRSKKQKMVLDASLLNTQHYKVWINVKVEQIQGKE